jgi:predicted dehydrogenase
MSDSITRRTFVSTSAIAAPALLSAQSAGTKVNVGWVGLGNRGGKHIRTLMKVSKTDATVKAICDTFAPRLAKTKDDVITDQGTAPDTYHDYYKMLEDKSIDAVFIMTPEHLHHDMALAALAAGKHVYCEKPLSHTIEEGVDIVNAVKDTGKLFQVGTQRRSSREHRLRTLLGSGAQHLV